MITNRTYGMDADVISYNARIIAGGNQSLSMQSLRQLNQFVISIKKMNLWHNMVCWPLRANQNAGSGTIAYSLGGLIRPNGTLTNGPIWKNNGIVFDGINNYIAISNFTTSFLGTIFYSANHLSMTSSSPTPTSQKAMNFNGIEIGKAEGASFGVEATVLLSPYPTAGRSTTISGFGAGIQYTAAGVFNPSASSMARFYNGGSKNLNSSASYPAFSQSTTNIGTRSFSAINSPFNGTISIAIYFNAALSDADIASINFFYKTTLGQDLGLP
jgi:hypothetical protein